MVPESELAHFAKVCKTDAVFISSDRSSYSDSVYIVYDPQFFEILSISAIIHSSMMFYDVL